MKVIDLLNKIANGEEVPKKIKYNGEVYTEDNMYLVYCALGKRREEDFTPFLNDEIEILEEEKKIPEKINVIAYEKCIHEVTHKEKQLALEIRETQIAFNEIIDYLKSKGE